LPFGASTGSRRLLPDGSDVWFVPEYLPEPEATRLFDDLLKQPGWQQDHIRIYGKTRKLPRLHRWFAESNQPYRWSGIDMHPEPFPPTLHGLLQRIRSERGVPFNTALGNLYRDGRDSVSWHADDEPDLGPDPVIASLSLGATRRFLLRRKLNHSESLSFDLSHGSLLWMSGRTQALWEHCLPKTQRPVGTRINLTFRAILRAPSQASETDERLPTDQERARLGVRSH
jgi:alkylated DNA repair dioxygenase AlkB